MQNNAWCEVAPEQASGSLRLFLWGTVCSVNMSLNCPYVKTKFRARNCTARVASRVLSGFFSLSPMACILDTMHVFIARRGVTQCLNLLIRRIFGNNAWTMLLTNHHIFNCNCATACSCLLVGSRVRIVLLDFSASAQISFFGGTWWR